MRKENVHNSNDPHSSIVENFELIRTEKGVKQTNYALNQTRKNYGTVVRMN